MHTPKHLADRVLEAVYQHEGTVNQGMRGVFGTWLTRRVDIPLSLQTLDLETLAPGDRLYLEYNLGITAGGLGVSESTIARFSDPFNLSGNGVLGTITLQPVSAVPGPSTLLLLAVGMIGALAGRRRSSPVAHHRSPGAT